MESKFAFQDVLVQSLNKGPRKIREGLRSADGSGVRNAGIHWGIIFRKVKRIEDRLSFHCVLSEDQTQSVG